MHNSPNPRILYVDDDQDACEMIGLMLLLEVPGYGIMTVTTAAKALAIMKNEPVALFILDFSMPEISGIELCRRIRENDSQTPIMFYSAMGREVDRREAFEAGATAYLIKPNDLDILTETVKRLLAGSASISENEISISREQSFKRQ